MLLARARPAPTSSPSPPESGRPLDSSKLIRRFKQALDRAQIHQITFHELRHTFGTRMAAAGSRCGRSSTGWDMRIRRPRRSMRTTSRASTRSSSSSGRSRERRGHPRRTMAFASCSTRTPGTSTCSTLERAAQLRSDLDAVIATVDGDVFYLARGESSEAADVALTPERHGVRYDVDGQVMGVTIMNARSLLERDGHLTITLSHAVRVEARDLAGALS